ncbi:MAG: sensor histidine kinase [Haliea sp.]|jgi:two-component system sensor histidine kinase AlgZ|nr:sensor histidine kinase [Haliea sp.]
MPDGPEQQLKAAGGERSAPEFFIPDLCATRPVFVMILLAQLMVIVYVLAGSALPRFNWDLFGTSSLFVQWVLLLSLAVLCRMRLPFSRLGLPTATAGSLLLVMAVTALSSYVALQLYPQINRATEQNWWVLRNLLVAAVLTGILLRYFYLQQQLRLQEQLELLSRLESLRSRIHPHFLFNTLNSIASLIVSRPEAAEQAVEDLSELFRVSLRDDQRSATVADELRLCELYLGIEQLRLGDRLRVAWQVDEAAREQPMPSLLLQPLVENAVYHGLSQLPAGGLVHIDVKFAGGEVRVRVENPVPAQSRRGDGHRMALHNIEQRLQALYGSRASLAAGRERDHFTVRLSYAPGAAL